MECNECRYEISSLFDKEADQMMVARVKGHLLKCASCSIDYQEMEEVISMLKPKLQPDTPLLLKQNIINHLSKEDFKMKSRKPTFGRLNSPVKKVISVAAALGVIMLIIPFLKTGNGFMNSTARAADSFISSSIKATGLIKSMMIHLLVRTDARDNFALVDAEYDMVEHTIIKSFEKPEKWRIDKGKRIIVFDGKNQYLWIADSGTGYKAGSDINFSEWFRILLDPETILLKEQAGIDDKSSKIKMEEKNGELHMLITSKALGNFINGYRKNHSIAEADNRREYIFDDQTKLIKSIKVFLLDGKKETLILESEKIEYNTPVDTSWFSISLPEGVVWNEISAASDIGGRTFSNITSKRAAEIIFEAMAKNDWDSVTDVFQQKNPVMMNILKSTYGGLEVIKIGESFKSGLYPGEFVPYEVKLRDGTTKKHKLALRNDNKNKLWLVDGGL